MGFSLDFDLNLVEWLAAFMISSTVFLGAVWASRKSGILKDPGLSDILWRGAIVLSFLASLPSVAHFGSVVELSSPRIQTENSFLPSEAMMPAASEHVVASASTQASDPVLREAVAREAAPTEAPATEFAESNSLVQLVWTYAQENPLHILLGVWLLLSALFVVGILHSYWRSVRSFGARRLIAGDHELVRLLNGICDNAGVAKTPRLTVSQNVFSPVSLPGYEICMPHWALEELDDSKLKSMLAHELGHLQRRDHLLFPALHVLACLFIFQPLLAVAIRDLQSLAEIAADEWAANNTKDAKSMAHTLYACAEKISLQRKPTWGITMANDKSALKTRIERLIELQKLSVKRVGLAPKALALAAMLGAAMMMPQFQFAAADQVVAVATGAGQSSMSRVGTDGDRTNISISDDDYELQAKIRGEFKFNDEETDISFLATDASVQIETEEDGVERRVRFTEENGEIVKSYRIDGDLADFDVEAQAWLSRTILRMHRITPFQAEERVGRLLARGGADSVLDEVDEIPTDFAARVYLGYLVEQAKLDDDQLNRAVSRVAGFESDYEVRIAFDGIFEHQNVSAKTLPLMLAAARNIESDYELRMLLTPIMENIDADDEARQMVLELLPTIDSDYELRLVVQQAIASDILTSSTVKDILVIAGDNVESDYELRQIVSSTVSELDGDEGAVTAVVTLLGDIEGDYERRMAVTEIAPHVGQNQDLWLDLLDQISAISGDYEKRMALTTIHALMPKSDTLLGAYKDAAMTISSDHERGQALKGVAPEASTTVTMSIDGVPGVAGVPGVPGVPSVSDSGHEVVRHEGNERQRLQAQRESLLAMQVRLAARAAALEARMKELEAQETLAPQPQKPDQDDGSNN